jgi:predicted glycogen debranching enzyme
MKFPVISIKQEALSHFEDTLQKEWLITNGLGGYASSTVLGMNTRKYHGLLVGAFHPPGDRRVCLAKLDEEVSVGNETSRVGVNEFQTGVFPERCLLPREHSTAPFPKYVYLTQNVEVEKTIFMLHERNATIALYNIINKNEVDATVRVFPLVNWRRFHSVTDRWKTPTDLIHTHDEKQVKIGVSNPETTLIMATTNGHYHFADKWVERLYYREEAARGESCLDDCYQPGYFEVPIRARKGEHFALVAVTDECEDVAREMMNETPLTMDDMEALHDKESDRHRTFLTGFYDEHKSIVTSDWLSWLISATDAFVVRRLDADRLSVIAGYYWFDVWGRDTFVSLPGLMLVTGRFEAARKVFLSFEEHCLDGLVPNCVPEAEGEPAYNSVDASLWYVNAAWQYLKYTADFKFVRERLWQTLQKIAENYSRGTKFGIHVDIDGLLSHGGQLTWMDAVVDGQPVTPRSGKAVEVQALWYNALRILELITNKLDEKGEAERFRQLAERTKKSFNEKFWNNEKNCLYDVIGENGQDASLRPNQILAVALEFTMLDKAKSEGVVDVVQRELLTPFGLRTLARNDPRYVGVYVGDRRSRDRAYHNGTVWPWLIGPFTTAYLKTKGLAEFRREYALRFLSPLLTKQVFGAGMGSLSEVFDGEPPHKPRGCIAQAWSVAEPVRAYVEDIMQNRPKHEREFLQSSA